MAFVYQENLSGFWKKEKRPTRVHFSLQRQAFKVIIKIIIIIIKENVYSPVPKPWNIITQATQDTCNAVCYLKKLKKEH